MKPFDGRPVTYPPKTGSVDPATTAANGGFTLNHNLGWVPGFIQVAPRNSQLIAVPDFTSATTTTVLVYVRRISDGSIVASTNVGFVAWVAFQ